MKSRGESRKEVSALTEFLANAKQFRRETNVFRTHRRSTSGRIWDYNGHEEAPWLEASERTDHHSNILLKICKDHYKTMPCPHITSHS